MFLINFLWSYLFETGTDRAEILHSCQTRGTEQLLPWSKRELPLKKSEIPWFAVVLSARARARAPGPPELGASSPYPEGEGGSSRWRARFYFLLYKCKIYAKNHGFIKANLIEFRLQFRHPPSLRSPIWSFFLPYKCIYIWKNNVFISANLIEFRLQFRHPLSFRSPIWWFILPWICYAYEKKHVFLKAKLIEFASTDALPPDGRAQRQGTLESGQTATEIQILSWFFGRFWKGGFQSSL